MFSGFVFKLMLINGTSCAGDEQRRVHAAHLLYFLEYKTWKRASKGGRPQRIGCHV